MNSLLRSLALLLLLASCSSNRSAKIDLNHRSDKAEIFAPGIISTDLYERDMAISTDGNEIVFTLSDYRQTKRCLVMIKKSGDKWGSKEVLSFSGVYNDIEPFFSADGKRLFFVSDRPIDKTLSGKDYNIWVSERSKKGWDDPEPLPSMINSESDEFYPSLATNNDLYFTAERRSGFGSEDIFISRFTDGKYTEPVPLDTCINSHYDEFNAYVSPDEDLIIFSSYGRKDDLGRGDLYISRKNKDGKWEKAANMGPGINSDKLDYCPFIDIPRGNFYFTSERSGALDKRIENIRDVKDFAGGVLNGFGNIYRISSDKLNRD